MRLLHIIYIKVPTVVHILMLGTIAVGATKKDTVITPSTMGNYDEYKVYTIGTHSNSAATSDLRITCSNI